MNQPSGERRVQRSVVTTTTRGAKEHNKKLAGALLPVFGVLGLGVAGLSHFDTVGRIENDLTHKVEAAASAAGVTVNAKFSGQDGTLTCSSPLNGVDLKQLGEAIKGVNKIKIDDATCTAAAPAPEPAPATTVNAIPATTVTAAPTTEAAPATTVPAVSQLNASASLAKGATGVVLAGTVDSEAQHSSLVEAATAAFGSGNVTDNLKIAGVDGIGSDANVVGLNKLIAGLKGNVIEGEAGYNGTALYLKGTYPDDSAKAKLDGIVGDVGVAASEVDLTAGAPAVAATFKSEAALGADGKLTLTGVVPNDAARTALIDAATLRVGTANVVDQLTIAAPAGTDDPGVDRLASLIGAMPPNLYQGTAGWDGSKFYASGQYLSAASKAAFEQVATAAGVATSDLAIEPRAAATVDEAAALEKELNDLVAASPIPFDPSKATLRPEAPAILDQVAALAKKYAGVGIAVNGHTDSDGAEAGNQKLSEDRANAVREALIQRNVPAEQLTAQGFGETQPIAPNDTPANKALNRRVVFAVAKQ